MEDTDTLHLSVIPPSKTRKHDQAMVSAQAPKSHYLVLTADLASHVNLDRLCHLSNPQYFHL